MYSSFLKITLMLGIGLPAPLLALHHPHKSGFDSRIRYTPYNAFDVVQLNTTIGIVTHIVLEERREIPNPCLWGRRSLCLYGQKEPSLFKAQG